MFTWTDFKTIVASNSLQMFYVETTDIYTISAFVGQKEIGCKILKNSDDSTDKTDFETNYKALCNKKTFTVSEALSEPNGYRFRGTRIIAQAMPVGTTTVDYTVAEERYLTGAAVKAYGAGHFDYVEFKVVAPAGHAITGGAPVEVVLDTFAPSWGISDDLQLIELYKARVYAGLIIRIIYHNTTSSPVDVWVNAFLHKKA